MTKNDIAKVLANRSGISVLQATALIDTAIDTVKDALNRGETIYLRGFGSLVVRKRAPKLARDIARGTTVMCPEHRKVVFVNYPSFSKILNAK